MVKRTAVRRRARERDALLADAASVHWQAMGELLGLDDQAALATLSDGDAAPKKAEEKIVYVCLGPHAWGKGFSETGALREAERAGGHKLRKKERVFYTCTDPWAWVDDMGMIRHAADAVVRRHKEGARR